MRLKRGLIIGLVLVLIILVIYLLYYLFVVPKTNFYQQSYLLGAHRGDSKNYLENTIPAFESALVQEKYKFIEFDVGYTKDKKIIISHDDSLSRLFGQDKKISDLNYDEVVILTNNTIPTYEEVMKIVAGKNPLL